MTEVVAALIWEGDKFMICRRPAHKARGLLWEFVGGKVEPGETKEQALVRECREELAVTLSVGNVFMDVVHEYPDITVHLTLFNATIADGVPQKLEHNDIRWIAPSEIPINKFVNTLMSAVVDPTAASACCPLKCPTTMRSTALNISCRIPDTISGSAKEINLSIMVPLHISISYLFLFNFYTSILIFVTCLTF